MSLLHFIHEVFHVRVQILVWCICRPSSLSARLFFQSSVYIVEISGQVIDCIIQCFNIDCDGGLSGGSSSDGGCGGLGEVYDVWWAPSLEYLIDLIF